MNNDTLVKWIKVCFLILAGSHLMYQSIQEITPYPTGDGPEYVLMTEAFYNHGSPKILLSDLESFKQATIKFLSWDKVPKNHAFEPFERFLKSDKHTFKNSTNGLFTAQNGNHYFFHFSGYSLVNVPVRAFADINNFPPLKSFQLTNAILIIITCFLLLFYSPFRLLPTILISLLFIFSSVYWYLGWTSPEVFTTCLVTMAFWFYFQDKKFISIFLLSIASMQNQPIIILSAFMSISVLLKNGIQIKAIVQLFFANVLALVPPIFYLYHFDTTNLIKDLHYLSWEVVTINRVWGFFTDLNQGMILAIPLLLIVYPFLWFRTFYKSITQRILNFDLLLPFFLLCMIIVFCTMINWNHGMAVINRYATWSSAVILIHTVFLLRELKPIKQIIILLICGNVQIISVIYNNKYYNKFDWDQELTKAWAEWVYEQFPALYNPDPVIFFVRTSRDYNFKPENSPVAYINKYGSICKMLIHSNHLDKLSLYGISESQIAVLSSSKKIRNGWSYLNKSDIESSFTPEELLSIKRENRIKLIIDKIQVNEGWNNDILKKAEEYNMPYEEILRLDAMYIYNEEQK